MNRNQLYYAYWILIRFAKKLGAWGLIAIALMLASLLFYLTSITKIEQEIIAAQNALNHAQKNEAVITPIAVAATQLSMHDITAYYHQLPIGSVLPNYLRVINEAALKQHLTLNRGDYKLTLIKKAEFSRYQIVFPVVGKYTQIRQFIAAVLATLPALGLSDVQITRENTLSPTVEARLEFVLYLQSASW